MASGKDGGTRTPRLRQFKFLETARKHEVDRPGHQTRRGQVEQLQRLLDRRNRTVLEYLKNHADYIAPCTTTRREPEQRLLQVHGHDALLAEKAIRITEGLIAEAMTKAERAIRSTSPSTSNVWYCAKGEEGKRGGLQLEDALVVSTFLNILITAPMWSRWPSLRSWSTSSFDLSHQKVRGTRSLPVTALRPHCRHVARHLRRRCDTYALGEADPSTYRRPMTRGGPAKWCGTNRHRGRPSRPTSSARQDVSAARRRYTGSAARHQGENSVTRQGRENRDQRGTGAKGDRFHLCLPGALVHADPRIPVITKLTALWRHRALPNRIK